MEFMHQMDEIVKQRDQLQNQFATVQRKQKELEDENHALKEEVRFEMRRKNEISKNFLIFRLNQTQISIEI